ncbi:DUF4081 domain-containing GNAT family N-acetyltransferase [Rarobacter faecitabidus]|uniref:N-acetyltransferase domain-containing protein n=1 Tax=Rarobacter faecitabidus TaxID=13243 RepID=A0A542ZWH7_RARFA|nr:DUF4081 domain-containing GNAT family N-acetyltransferase [Rarobacter faecitabidus]TQL64682.1 hypothetical protein FB461_1191 [Rarobacter faecitabidus]
MRQLFTGLRLLREEDLAEALKLCRVDPAASILAAARIEGALRSGLRDGGGMLLGYPRFGELQAFAWVGSNIVPVNPFGLADFRPALADGLSRHGTAVSSIVGASDEVLGLWRMLVDDWPAPRDIRPVQYSMVLRGAPRVMPDTTVRLAEPSEHGELLPACVAMFTEEVGYSPLKAAPHSYPERVRWLIDSGSAWISRGEVDGRSNEIRFKTEVGATTSEMGQLQGVWVHPSLRGRGLAAPAIAAVAASVASQGRTPSLYVNDFNAPAIAAYERVGFERVGTYATILF